MKQATITNEIDSNKKKCTEWHFTFSQEIIDMIVDNFDINDGRDRLNKLTLDNLCKVSASWEHAALKKLYAIIDEDVLDDITVRPYLANYVKVLYLVEDNCKHCYTLQNTRCPNLKKVTFFVHTCCDDVQQFFGQNASIEKLKFSMCSHEAALGILKSIMKARAQNPNYQPLLSYKGPLDKTIASCLKILGVQSIHAWSIDSSDIVPSFSQFSALQDISLAIYEEGDSLIEGLKYLNKFKSLSSFGINAGYSYVFSKNVYSTIFENVLKPNATTLQKIRIGDVPSILKLPLDQQWPNLKLLDIFSPKFCPMNVISFCEKAPNLQDITIMSLDKESMMQNKIDVPIKIINSLKKLYSMEIYIGRCVLAGGALIRYIQSQNVDETLRIEDGEPKSKFFELEEQYNNNNNKFM